eukprot:sb/3475004/
MVEYCTRVTNFQKTKRKQLAYAAGPSRCVAGGAHEGIAAHSKENSEIGNKVTVHLSEREEGLIAGSKQPIRSRYLGHVTGYQPIRDQYLILINWVVGERGGLFRWLVGEGVVTCIVNMFPEWWEKEIIFES